MARLWFTAFFAVFFAGFAQAAEVKTELNGRQFHLNIEFEKGYSDVNTLKLEKSYIISFQTAEDVQYSEEFWDSPVSQAFVHEEGDRKKLIIDFAGEPVEPQVSTDTKKLTVSFVFPEVAPVPQDGVKGAYVRMITGLGIVLAVILVLFWLIRAALKRRTLSELPGTGRLLGKVDLEIRKSLYFYELGEYIYIFGVTDMSVNLIEKITDEDEINRIKSGFSRKSEFGPYLNFFSKGSDLKGDLDASRNIIREKLESVKKR
jgi:flagellar biogenesis protein FliO